MANIASNLQKILYSIYGRDVRQAIHDSISDINDVCTSAEEAAADSAGEAAAVQELVDGMTASASTTEEDTSVVISVVDGHYHLAFGVKKGQIGSKFYSGTAITGTSQTPAAYPTGLEYVNIGDMYFYSGTAVSDVGNVYICTVNGNATTAQWKYVTNIRGVAGSGAVSFVDGISPDTNGNIVLPTITNAEINAIING